MIQGVVTTQLTPVGVGWGNYVVAWLLTYSGSDCQLWRLVYSKCVESRLCRELAEMLMNELRKHKCYDPALIDELDAEIIEADQAKPTNQPRPSKPQQRTTRNHSRLLEIKAPPLGPPSLPQPSPPNRWAAPDSGAWPAGDG